MTSPQKQQELKQYRDIVLATIEYLIERLGGSFVCDELDPVSDYYQQQKILIEKYYKQRRLDRLQQKFLSLTKGLQSRADLNFAGYIKKMTDYDIDIFKDLHKRVNNILEQKEIKNEEELRDISSMLEFYKQTFKEIATIEKLKNLVIEYSKSNQFLQKQKAGYSEVLSREKKDGKEIVTVRFSTGPKPKHLKEQEAISPDGKRRLHVTQWSDGKNASTYVTIMFPTSSGAVYSINGICDISAFWKDNTTIVIETTKDCLAHTQHKSVRSFDDIIAIEYLEN
ncbi:MAG: hypothetical protein ABJB05_12390 [Parafilimonas sp.]